MENDVWEFWFLFSFEPDFGLCFVGSGLSGPFFYTLSSFMVFLCVHIVIILFFEF